MKNFFRKYDVIALLAVVWAIIIALACVCSKANAQYVDLAHNVTGILPVANGGTGGAIGSALLPIEAYAGNGYTFSATDFGYRMGRSNSGTSMSDTFPATGAAGLINGVGFHIANTDASAPDTITAGSGTTINGGSTFAIVAGREVWFTFDAANNAWRFVDNTNTALLSTNNLSDIGSASTSRTNLGLAIGTNVEAWSSVLDALAAGTAFSASGTGASVLAFPNTTSYTYTFPAASGTLPEIGKAQTWSAAQTFTNSDFLLLGSSTGATTFASANASGTNYTVTVPAATDTIVELTQTQTLTNKSIAGSEINSSIVGATYGGTGVNNGSSTITLGAALTTTGTGAPTLAFPATTSYTYTYPANTGTLDELGFAATYTAAKTFTNSDLLLLGSSTGATTFTSANASGTNYTATVPAATDTIVELTQTQTLTNKSIAGSEINSGTVSPTYGGTGVNNSSSTITIGGNTSFVGAYTFAGTLTGATAVTFPTSGTLATTAGSITTATNIANGTTNQMLYQTAASTTGFISAVNGALVNTNSSGVPAETATPVIGVNGTTTGTLGLATSTGSGATTTISPSAVTSAVAITLPAASGTLLYSGGAAGTPSSITLTNASGTAASLTAGAASTVTGETFPGSGLIIGTTDTQTMSAKTLTTPIVNGYTETPCTPTITAGAVTISATTCTFQKLSLVANTTITLPTPVAGQSYTLLVCYGGVYTVTWAITSGALSWPAATAPTATSVNGKCDIYSFASHGTSYTFGQSGGTNFTGS